MMLKIDFLKKCAVVAVAAPLVALTGKAKADAAQDSDPLVGLWEATITTGSATYRYFYSISTGAYIATGNLDENYMGFKYGPTMGAYVREDDGSYRYRERGYAFDLKGKNAGTFAANGTLRLSSDGNAFSGPGTWKQLDGRGKAVATETLTVEARRLAV
jgi:hypothetical protein